MRIPNNVLKIIEEETGISNILICDYLANRRNMSKKRALQLGSATKKLGYDFTAADWMFRPDKIKATLIDNSTRETAQTREQEKEAV